MYNFLLTYDNSISSFIISFFTFISVLCIFCRITEKKPSGKQIALLMIFDVCFSAGYAVTRLYDVHIAQLLSYLIIPLALSFLEKRNKSQSIAAGLISVSIFHVVKMVSMLLVSLVFWLIGHPGLNCIIALVYMILTTLLSVLFMRIRRFNRGVKVICSKEYLGLGLTLSGIVFVLTNLDYSKAYEFDIVFVIFLLGIFISGVSLYYWIRRSLTAHYRERLQLKAEEHFRELLNEKELENEKLSQSNELLAKVVHRDNHLMNALNSSIDAYFESDSAQFRDELLREIQTLAKERGKLIEKEQRDYKLLPSTGNLMIDSAVNDLYIKAAAHGIDFDLTVSAAVGEIIGKYISQTDLQTLLCDHIKDAIIAVDAAKKKNGKILVDLSVKEGSYCVTFFDNGVDFEPETLAKLGRERVTTHADNGGSGIGFMTTFETLRKAYASLIITEFENKTPFPKSVCIRFDGENAFVIQSYRKAQIEAALDRDDVVLSL